MFLRQSTSQVVRFGPFLDNTDFKTAETALIIAQADMQLSKDGGAFAQKNAAGNATHDTDGWYSTTLNATDTATVGELLLQIAGITGALPVWTRWWVIEEAVYDDIFGAAGAGYLKPTTAGRTLDVAATGEAGVDFANIAGTLDAADIGADAITAAKVAPGAIAKGDQLTGLNDPTAAAIADAVWDEAQAGHVAAGSFGEIATEIAAIPTTAMRGTDGANTTTPPTVGAVADAVWDEAQAGHVAAGSFGEIATEIAAIPTTAMRGTDNAALAIVATETRLAELDAANLPTDIAGVQARLPAALVGGRIDASVGAMAANSLTASALAADATNEIADGVKGRTLTESYAADGVAPTFEQALMAVLQQAGEFAISGTTITVKKLDGVTTAMTFTLDDATNPTSRTRAS